MKRTIALTLTLALFVAVGSTVRADAVSATLYGDVNVDNGLSAEDMTVLARHLSGVQTITDEQGLANADVNADGGIDALDLTIFARFLATIDEVPFVDPPASVDPVAKASLFSYEDYLAYTKTEHGLSDEFVFYDEGVDRIGAFDALIIGDADSYLYDVRDANNMDLTLYFYTKQQKNLSGARRPDDVAPFSGSLAVIDEATFAKLPQFCEVIPAFFEEARYYKDDNGIIYVYIASGKCYAVYWTAGDRVVNIYGPAIDNRLGDCPMDREQTFLTRLLTAETAAETVADFNLAAFGA